MEEIVSYFEHRYGLNPVAVFFSVLITTVGMFIHVWWTTRPKPRKDINPVMLVLHGKPPRGDQRGTRFFIGKGDSACVVEILGKNKFGFIGDPELCPVVRDNAVEKGEQVGDSSRVVSSSL